MASSSTSFLSNAEATSSSLSQSSLNQATAEDADDNEDGNISNSRDQDLLYDDLLDADAVDLISFKRKQKQQTAPRLLSTLSTGGLVSGQAPPRPMTPMLHSGGPQNIMGGGMSAASGHSNSKDGGTLDWYGGLSTSPKDSF
jgi:hypothetical protein